MTSKRRISFAAIINFVRASSPKQAVNGEIINASGFFLFALKVWIANLENFEELFLFERSNLVFEFDEYTSAVDWKIAGMVELMVANTETFDAKRMKAERNPHCILSMQSSLRNLPAQARSYQAS